MSNHIDVEAAKAARIGVKNVSAYSTPSVVQHTLGLVLALTSHLRFTMSTALVASGLKAGLRPLIKDHFTKYFPKHGG